MRSKQWRLLGLAYTAVLVGAGCGGAGGRHEPSSGDPEADRRADMRVGAAGATADTRTLYDRLGGEEKIAAIVGDMTARVIADPRVNFERTDVSKGVIGSVKEWEPTPEKVALFKRHMIEFLTLASGGPAQYSGRDMREVHKGLRITNNEFDAMVGDIKASMDRVGVARREQRDLLAVVETTRKEIVEQK